MKKIKILGVLALFLLIGFTSSCSSDSDSNAAGENLYPGFKLKINGEVLQLGLPTPESAFNGYPTMSLRNDIFNIKIVLGGITQILNINFTKDGKFVSSHFSNYPANYESFPHYTSHYYNFHLDSVDEVNMKAKGSFAGRIYLLNNGVVYPDSEPMDIEVEFDLNYYDDSSPFISTPILKAQLDGVEWKPFRKIPHGVINDGPYVFKMIFPNVGATPAGSYTFDSASTVNRIEIGKYNPATWQYDYYQTTGTMNISEVSLTGGFGNQYYLYKGTFSFTAVNPDNPSDVHQITGGQFNWSQNYN